MVYYYLDLATYGKNIRPDPATDTIIAIVLCAFDPAEGRLLQDPIVLTSWGSGGERELVQGIHARMAKKRPFDFIPVGFNVLFDLWFLRHKFKEHLGVDLGDRFYLDWPYLDLKHVAVLANRGRFKGVALSGEGAHVKEWYETQQYDRILKDLDEKLHRFQEAYATWAQQLS